MSSTAITAQGIAIARLAPPPLRPSRTWFRFRDPVARPPSSMSPTWLQFPRKSAWACAEGQLTLTVHYNPDDLVHQGLRTDRANRTRRQFKITFTDTNPATWTFYGYVTHFSVQGGVDAVVQASVTIEIDGEITES